MKPTVALLRAVNVGGTGKLPMAELKAMCEACGFEAVRTYIASGNVVFRTGLTEAKVKAVLEAKLASYAGRPVGVMVRGKKELEQILAANPFPDAPPNRTLVTFLDKRPPANAAEQATNVKNEEIQVGRREIYVHYGDGMGSSRLKVPAAKNGTARNINTVRKLVSLLAALSILFVLVSCTAAGPIVADRSGIAPLRGVAAGPGRIAVPIRRNQSYLVAVIGRGAGGQQFPGDPELVRLGPDEERGLQVVRTGKRARWFSSRRSPWKHGRPWRWSGLLIEADPYGSDPGRRVGFRSSLPYTRMHEYSLGTHRRSFRGRSSSG